MSIWGQTKLYFQTCGGIPVLVGNIRLPVSASIYFLKRQTNRTSMLIHCKASPLSATSMHLPYPRLKAHRLFCEFSRAFNMDTIELYVNARI